MGTVSDRWRGTRHTLRGNPGNSTARRRTSARCAGLCRWCSTSRNRSILRSFRTACKQPAGDLPFAPPPRTLPDRKVPSKRSLQPNLQPRKSLRTAESRPMARGLACASFRSADFPGVDHKAQHEMTLDNVTLPM